MLLSRHADGRWCLDGRLLPEGFSLAGLLATSVAEIRDSFQSAAAEEPSTAETLSPVEPAQEVWASGVTYLRSRVEREAESTVADVYAKVYEADRPELFFKSAGWRVVGNGQPVRIRRDSTWSVPEPELTLVLNRFGEIVGYTAGNDMSSRSIEGENPLYLPQAKTYDGSCSVGPAIVLADEADMADLPIRLTIAREAETVFEGSAGTGQMKRRFSELAAHLTRELSFPNGCFLMTGTGIVPPPDFTLHVGDVVTVQVGELTLTNPVG